MLRKISSVVGGKTLEDYVAAATNNEPGSEAHRKALWGIREVAASSKNSEAIVHSGALRIMVASLSSGSSDEKLWALFVLRMLADNEVGASFVLQEPNAVEALVTAVATSVVGSEHAKRSIETFKGLAQHLSTQVLLAREDVYKVMVAAMNAQPAEAKVALSVYAMLSELESGHLPAYAKAMNTEKARSTLEKIYNTKADFSQAERDLAKRVLNHIQLDE